MAFPIGPLKYIPQHVDTSRSGLGNLKREVARLRQDISLIDQTQEKLAAQAQARRLESPYAPDRGHEVLIKDSPSENNWRKESPALEALDEAKNEIAKFNLKKLNIL